MQIAHAFYRRGVCQFALTYVALAVIDGVVSTTVLVAPQDSGSPWIRFVTDHVEVFTGLSGLSLFGIFVLFWSWMRHTGSALRAIGRHRAHYRLWGVWLFYASPLMLCALGAYLVQQPSVTSFPAHLTVGSVIADTAVRVTLGLGWVWLAVAIGRGVTEIVEPEIPSTPSDGR